MTNPIVGARVLPSTTEGELSVTTSQSTAERLRAIFDRDPPPQPFEGTGCSDHVGRRDLRLSVTIALALLVVLIALLAL